MEVLNGDKLEQVAVVEERNLDFLTTMVQEYASVYSKFGENLVNFYVRQDKILVDLNEVDLPREIKAVVRRFLKNCQYVGLDYYNMGSTIHSGPGKSMQNLKDKFVTSYAQISEDHEVVRERHQEHVVASERAVKKLITAMNDHEIAKKQFEERMGWGYRCSDDGTDGIQHHHRQVNTTKLRDSKYYMNRRISKFRLRKESEQQVRKKLEKIVEHCKKRFAHEKEEQLKGLLKQLSKVALKIDELRQCSDTDYVDQIFECIDEVDVKSITKEWISSLVEKINLPDYLGVKMALASSQSNNLTLDCEVAGTCQTDFINSPVDRVQQTQASVAESGDDGVSEYTPIQTLNRGDLRRDLRRARRRQRQQEDILAQGDHGADQSVEPEARSESESSKLKSVRKSFLSKLRKVKVFSKM